MGLARRRCRILLIVAVCAALAGGGCSASDAEPPSSVAGTPDTPTSTNPPPDPWPTAAWPVSTPEEQGMDSEVLADFVEAVVATGGVSGGVDSVTVVRNGYVVLDTVVYPFPEDTGHIVHSVTKSVTATLVGIAVDRGFLDGVHVPVVDVLDDAAPDTVEDLKASLRVEDLLTMSTGLDCRDSYRFEWEGLIEMIASDDWSAHVLALPMIAEPGTRFEYCNGASYLLSAILSEVTGMPAAEFATEVLFEPLGITDYHWPASPDGISVGWGELILHPADMAKIGYLYLRNGEWEGDQVVSRSWIEAATTSHIRAGTASDGYGYQWWVDDDGYALAIGFGGQYIIVVPESDLIVVFTSGLPLMISSRPVGLFTQYVVPAIVSDEPLPANPAGQSRLADVVAVAEAIPEPKPFELPATAGDVSGARYEFQPNDAGYQSFILSFNEASASLRLDVDFAVNPLRFSDSDEPIDIEIGLDGRFLTAEMWGQLIAARGTWQGDDTFVVESQMIGQADRTTFEFDFGDGIATVVVQDRIAGSTLQLLADLVD